MLERNFRLVDRGTLPVVFSPYSLEVYKNMYMVQLYAYGVSEIPNSDPPCRVCVYIVCSVTVLVFFINKPFEKRE